MGGNWAVGLGRACLHYTTTFISGPCDLSYSESHHHLCLSLHPQKSLHQLCRWLRLQEGAGWKRGQRCQRELISGLGDSRHSWGSTARGVFCAHVACAQVTKNRTPSPGSRLTSSPGTTAMMVKHTGCCSGGVKQWPTRACLDSRRDLEGSNNNGPLSHCCPLTGLSGLCDDSLLGYSKGKPGWMDCCGGAMPAAFSPHPPTGLCLLAHSPHSVKAF